MSASSSSDNTNNNGERVPDEECSFKGKFQDFKTTVKLSVDSIKERFNEEGRKELESHEFKIKDETFTIEIVFNEEKINKSAAKERWFGVFLKKTDTCGSPESIVSFKCEFLNIERSDMEYNKKTLKRGLNWGWQPLVNKRKIEALPNNTLNLFCTVTLHIQVGDSRITTKSRSGANLEEEIVSLMKRKIGLPTAHEKPFTDFVIEGNDGIVIKCHRVFLASNSPVFKAMLNSDMKETKGGTLKLDFCGEFLQHFVDFLYDTSLDVKIVLEHFENFLLLADKYDIAHMKLMIEDILIKNLSTDVMINYYALGDLYSAKNLKDASRTFIVNNRDCFKDKEFIKQLQKLNPERIVEIMGIVM